MDFISVKKHITLSEVALKDVATFVEYLNDKDIYTNTFNIPHSYTKEDRGKVINIITERKKENSKTTNWAVQNKNGQLYTKTN